MLEGGRSEALSKDTIGRLAALLGVTLETGAAPAANACTGPSGRLYCPQAGCPSNVPFAVNGAVIFSPRPQPVSQAARHCAFCGEVLAAGCPACGEPVGGEGGCCRACGAALVSPPAAIGASAEGWAAERRRQIADWRALLA